MAAAATIALFDVLDEHHDVAVPQSAEEDCRARVRTAEILGLLDRALLFIGAGIRALQDDPGTASVGSGPVAASDATVASDSVADVAATSRAPEPTTR